MVGLALLGRRLFLKGRIDNPVSLPFSSLRWLSFELWLI